MVNFCKLGIETSKDLMNYFDKNMHYGFVYKKKVFTDNEPDFQKNMDKFYKLRVGEDFIKSGYGVCWDFCELEREFFLSKKIEHECYFIESFVNRQEGGPTHTFALFKENRKWFWFEYAWQFNRGIWQYASKEEALADVLKKFEVFYDRRLYDIKLYKTKRLRKILDTFQYVERCINGEKIDLKNLEI